MTRLKRAACLAQITLNPQKIPADRIISIIWGSRCPGKRVCQELELIKNGWISCPV
jgi:hypothetical protein